MSIPIVTTPARTHLLDGTTSQVGAFVMGRTVCGKTLSTDGFEYGTHFGTHEGGDLVTSITCKNCRRTIAPSVVVFAGEDTAVVGPNDVVAPAVPDSPRVEVRWNPAGVWEVHVNFSGAESEPEFFLNGYEAEVTV